MTSCAVPPMRRAFPTTKTQGRVLTSRGGVVVAAPKLRWARLRAKESSDDEEKSPFAETLRRNPISAVLDSYAPPDEGNEMILFPFVRKVQKRKADNDYLVDPDLAAARREELQNLAAAELVNIDADERRRRSLFGAAVLTVVVGLDVWLVAQKVGFWGRFAVTPLLFFGLAYVASGRVGLCNIAQSDMWQVDGEGLKKIQDPNLAQRLRAKVNRFNRTAVVATTILSVAFSAIPLN